MSLVNALDAAVSSLGALNRAINTTSQNVANATNEDYNAQEAIFSDVAAGGVRISEIRRKVNDGLLNNLLNEVTGASASAVRDSTYLQLEQFIGTIAGETPLVDIIDDFRNAWKAFEAAPESNAARTDIVLRGQALAAELERLSTGLDTTNRQVFTDIDVTVVDLNDSLTRVQELNAEIVRERAAQRPTGGLESERDGEILDIAEILDIQIFARENGSVALYTKTGIDLVDSGASQFTWDEGTFTLTKTGSTSTNLVPTLPDGRLRAQINIVATDSTSLQDTSNGVAVIQKLKNQLDELAFSFVDTSVVTATGTQFVQRTTDVTTITGIDAGDQITVNVGGTDQTVTVTAGQTAAALVAALDALTNVTARIDASGQVRVSSQAGALVITDTGGAATALGLVTGSPQTFDQPINNSFARAYQQESATGSVALTTTTNLITTSGLTDPSTFTVTNAGAAATTITIGTGAGEAQTVADLLVDLNDIEGIRARLDGSGFLEISSINGTLVITDATATPLASLGFTTVANVASLEGTPQTGEASAFFEGETGTTPDDVSRVNFRVNDTLTSNSENVKQLVATDVIAAMNDNQRDLVGSGVSFTNQTYTGLAANILTEVSRQGEIATRTAERTETARLNLFQALRDDVGVNIDEELAQLTVLQNSFAASARVLSVVDDLFATLETIVQ